MLVKTNLANAYLSNFFHLKNQPIQVNFPPNVETTGKLIKVYLKLRRSCARHNLTEIGLCVGREIDPNWSRDFSSVFGFSSVTIHAKTWRKVSSNASTFNPSNMFREQVPVHVKKNKV